MHPDQLLKETHIHHQDEHGMIVTPLTMNASIELGRGTRWCFSDKNEDRNTFNEYTLSGYIIFYLTNERVYVPATGKEHQVKFCGHTREHYLLDIAVQPVLTELPSFVQKLILNSGLLPFLMEHGDIHPLHFPPKTFSFTEMHGMVKQGFSLEDFHPEDAKQYTNDCTLLTVIDALTTRAPIRKHRKPTL